MRDPAPWQKRYARMLLFACLLGVFGQYMFIGNAAGVSVILFLFGFYFIFYYAVRGRLAAFDKWKGQTTVGWLLLLAVGLLSLTYAIYANSLFRILNSMALPILVAAQTIWITRNKVHSWRGIRFVQDVLYQSIARPLANLPIPFGMVRSLVPDSVNRKTDSTWGRIRRVTIGLLIAAPILLVVVSLLASADRIFESWLAEIPQWLEGLSLGGWFLRAGTAILISLYTFCYLWGLLFPKAADESVSSSEGSGQVREKISFDPVIIGTLLVCVNLVYVLFASIQFSYLFGAANGLLPTGVAYAEYARRGFAELVLVAILNLGLLLAGLHYVRRAGIGAETVRKLLLSVLVGCTTVMLASAFSRLSLYEEAYGFTQTRLLVHGFMLFLGVLLAITFIRIWWEHFSLSKAYICISIAAYVLINYVNLDYRIASNNIERFERTGVIDISYLGRLSADAVPALIKLQARHPELLSLNTVIEKSRMKAQLDDKWPSWNFSKQREKTYFRNAGGNKDSD